MISLLSGLATALSVTALSQTSLRVRHIRQVEVEDKLIPKEFDGITMAVFSDVHLGMYVRTGLLARWVNVINRLKPDIVAFVGDLCDESTLLFRVSAVRAGEVLARINAPMGKFAVLGNHDVGTGFTRKFSRKALEAGGFEILSDQSRLLTPTVRLIGLKETNYSKPDLKKVIEGCNGGEYRILLVHQPDYADTAAKYGINIQFSGHSHGGQVRLPRTPIMCRTSGCRKYHTKEYNVSGMRLVITHGIGVHTVPFRVFANPDVLFVRFKSKR